MAETIHFLVERGITALGNIGLTPTSTNTLGGFKTQGRDEDTWPIHQADAKDVKSRAFPTKDQTYQIKK